MYTRDWQTGQTVYHRGRNKLRNWPSSRTQFLYFQSRTNFICFSFTIDERWGKKIEDSKGGRQLSRCGISSCCWLPGRCLAGFPSWKTLAQTTILRHYHCTSLSFPLCLSVPWMLRSRQSTVRTVCPHSVYLQICFLTQLNSKYHLISLWKQQKPPDEATHIIEFIILGWALGTNGEQ